MPLDPVHFDGITRHARRIGTAVDDREQRAFAQTVWEEFLDPLVDGDNRIVVEPLAEQALQAVDTETAALQETPYDQVYGLDSGTMNPTAFKNGVVLDVAQAALGGVPSALETHRKRTLVTAVHTDEGPMIRSREEQLDNGNATNVLLMAPDVSRFEESVVHELALYLAESTHALTYLPTKTDLFVLDGPVYPKGMLNWANRDPELEGLLYDGQGPRDVISNYIAMVEAALDDDRPLVGFVKNPSTKALTRALTEVVNVDWVDDTALFIRLLEDVSYTRMRSDDGTQRVLRERNTDRLTYTNWFRSRGGADRLIADATFGIDRRYDPSAYEVTFFVVYDPRIDVLFRVEAPYGITEDPQHRETITRWVLSEVATHRGPPHAVQKADSLARIDTDGADALKRALEDEFSADRHVDYNHLRWGETKHR